MSRIDSSEYLKNNTKGQVGNKMKVLSLFSGIGAFEKALDNLNVNYELVNFCELDKYAVKSYCAIHGVDEQKNLGDITKVDEKLLPENIDLVTYGFPCQDISLAGKQKGLFNGDGTKTRSGLFFEALRIIEETQPSVAIAENVKNLTSKKFSEQFKTVLQSLELAGYNNYWKILNAKDYGIPQNRERVFIVSIRKNIDTGKFQFPDAVPLDLRLKDILEDAVDEKYYINTEKARILIQRLSENEMKENVLIGGMQKNQAIKDDGIATTLTGSMGIGGGYVPLITEKECCDLSVNNPKFKDVANCIKSRYDAGISNQKSDGTGVFEVKQIGQLYGTEIEPNPSGGRVYGTDGILRTLGAGHGMSQPIIFVNQATSKGYAECEVGGVADLSFPNSETRRGRVQESGNICPTITAENSGIRRIEEATRGLSPDFPEDINEPDYYFKIRKLTPKECFRLMGFQDEDFQKAEKVNSNTQLYKQAGNSIVVTVPMAIYQSLDDSIPGIFNINQKKEKKKWN